MTIRAGPLSKKSYDTVFRLVNEVTEVIAPLSEANAKQVAIIHAVAYRLLALNVKLSNDATLQLLAQVRDALKEVSQAEYEFEHLPDEKII